MTGLEIGMLVTALGQLTGGIGKDLLNERPKKDLPPALMQSLSLANVRAMDPLGPGYDQARALQAQNSANQLAAAQAAGNPMEAIQSIVGAQNEGLSNLAAMQAQYRDTAQRDLQQKLSEVAGAEDTQWQINEFAPVADRKREGRDMIGAGTQNLFQLFSLLNGNPFGAAAATKTTNNTYGAPW